MNLNMAILYRLQSANMTMLGLLFYEIRRHVSARSEGH